MLVLSCLVLSLLLLLLPPCSLNLIINKLLRTFGISLTFVHVLISAVSTLFVHSRRSPSFSFPIRLLFQFLLLNMSTSSSDAQTWVWPPAEAATPPIAASFGPVLIGDSMVLEWIPATKPEIRLTCVSESRGKQSSRPVYMRF